MRLRLSPITLARLRLALVPAAVAAGIGAAAVRSRGTEPADGAEIAASLVVGWSFIASGLLAWERRPDNVTGKVMVATGFAWFAHELSFSTAALPWTVGQLLETTYIVGVGFLLVSFPDGRLHTTAERAVMAMAVLIVGPLQLAWMLLGYGDATGCDCPDNLLQIADAPDASEAIVRVQQVLGAVLALVTVAVLVQRWRTASPSRRHAIAPVLVTGTVVFALIVPWTLNDALDEPLGDWPDVAIQLALAAIPVAFLVGLVRARLARGAVAELVVALEDQPLRDALARALRDPSLTIAFWLEDHYVDADGRPITLPDAAGTVSEVRREGRRIAALIHDPAVADDPELVASVGAAAALALENERLQAQLRARLEELRASRARIVEAALQERRRIERDLHDGTQQRLVSIALTLGLAESRLDRDPAAVRPLLEEARAALKDALAELRELSQGIHPGILVERGLRAALEDLAYRARLPLELDVGLEARLPDQVEAAAYYVISEALTNVAKHAHATAVRVSVQHANGNAVVEVVDDGIGGADGAHGTGLRGLVDRVDALGGRLRVESPSGRGTIVHVEMPCA